MDINKKEDIVVTILTLAYNHEPYIRQCLDGIVMQQTNFKFELLIHDDASTDGTANIIREYESKYPEIIKPIYQKENQYSKKVPIGMTYLYPRAKGKYIALCEGDDYWTNPLKLQKQVDFLETHPDYIMCSHDFKVYHEEEGMLTSDSYYGKYLEKNNNTYTLNDYFNLWYTQPLTSVFRNGNYLKEIPFEKYKYFRDSIFFYYVLKEGKGILMPEIMGVYRKHKNGIYSGVNYKIILQIGIYNLENIYSVEKDSRIYPKMNIFELEYIYWIIAEDGKLNALIELLRYIRKTPISISFNLIYRLIKNHIKKS